MAVSFDPIAGKLIVVTGGTSGIGLAMAEHLHGRKGRIVVMANNSLGVDRTVTSFGGPSEEFDGYVCDVSVPEKVAETSVAIMDRHGVPDIVINNAGFATYRPFEEEEPAEIERLMSVNFGGAVRVTKAFLGSMIERRSGHIVNIASIAGAITLTPNGLYCASKHAMVAWSKCLSIELDRFGIAVSLVCPGRVETNFFNHETFRKRTKRAEMSITVPMKSVVKATTEAIERRQKLRFVPRYLGLLAWSAAAFGPLTQWPLNSLLRARIDSLYRDREANEGH